MLYNLLMTLLLVLHRYVTAPAHFQGVLLSFTSHCFPLNIHSDDILHMLFLMLYSQQKNRAYTKMMDYEDY